MLSYLSSFFSAKPANHTTAASKQTATTAEKEEEEKRILAELKERRPGCEYLVIVCDSISKALVHRLTVVFEELNANHLYVILHVTSGGEASDCAILTKMFNKFASVPGNRVTMCVPEIAMSSGAQIAICGTELIMGKYAHLTPFDDQIDGISVKNVKRITRKLSPEQQKRFRLTDHDTILQAEYLKKITKQELSQSLKIRGCDKKTMKCVKALFLDHSLYHSYPIDITMVRQTGLVVGALDDDDIWQAYKELHQLWLGDDV